MSNILAKTKTQLVGHIQYASGRDWRSHVEEELEKLKSIQAQIQEAEKKWKFDHEERKSLTNKESLVIKISNLKKK